MTTFSGINKGISVLGIQKELPIFSQIVSDKDLINSSLIDSISEYRKKNSSNIIKSSETTIPFPIITTDLSEKFDLPTLNTDAFINPYTSSSSESSIPFSAGVNNDNPFSDLLLNSLK